jgi:hypothetical protein
VVIIFTGQKDCGDVDGDSGDVVEIFLAISPSLFALSHTEKRCFYEVWWR